MIEPKIIQQTLFTAVEIPYSTTAASGVSAAAQHTIGMPKKQKPANPKNPIRAAPVTLLALVAPISYLSTLMSISNI